MDPSHIKRQGRAAAPKYSDRHPIAAIEKRVIDSPAFASLAFSSVAVLLLLARNIEKGKNGRTWLSAETARNHGVDAKTLYRALAELRMRGLIYQTLRGGNGKCSLFALTWLPLTKETAGLHVDTFDPQAWRRDPAIAPKKARDKFPVAVGHFSPSVPLIEDKSGSRYGDKNPHLECNTNTKREVRINATLAKGEVRADPSTRKCENAAPGMSEAPTLGGTS